ncbi:MAG: hypothetical protein ACLGH3_08785 [Actinomycetota bacterium]
MKRSIALLGSTTLAVALAAPTIPAQAASPGPYTATTAASALHHSLKTTTTLTSLDVGMAGASVDSEGLEPVKAELGWDLITEARGRAGAIGGLASLKLNGNEVAPGITNPRIARAIAPGDQPVSQKDLEQRVNTAVYARAIERTASPYWNGAACVIGEPIAQGTFQAALVQAVGSDPGSPTGPVKDPLAAVYAEAGAPARGAVDSRSALQLYAGAGNGFGLMAASMVTVAPVTIFEGTANEFSVEVDGPVILRARADGTPGGAAVTFQAPTVSYFRNGERTVLVPDKPTTIVLPGETSPVKVTLMLEEHTQKLASNGTSAEASGAAVKLVIEGAGATDTIAIGAVEAEVSVPADGITCTVPVIKDATPDSVGTGNEFTTNITVQNPYACDLADVILSDDIETLRNARFEITDAPGAISKTGGTLLDTGKVSWKVGTIEAGGEKTVTMVQEAQGSAGVIEDEATATGRLLNCIVSLAADSTDVTGLGLGSVGVTGSGTLAVDVSQVLGGGILPETGVGSAAPIGLAMLTLAGTLGALMRRRIA